MVHHHGPPAPSQSTIEKVEREKERERKRKKERKKEKEKERKEANGRAVRQDLTAVHLLSPRLFL